MSDLYWLEPDDERLPDGELVLLLLLVRGAFWKEVVGMSRTIVGGGQVLLALCVDMYVGMYVSL